MMEKNLSHSALFSGDENGFSDAHKGPRYSLRCVLAKAEGGIGFLLMRWHGNGQIFLQQQINRSRRWIFFCTQMRLT